MKQLEKSAKQVINAAQISAYLRVKFVVLVIMNISGAGVGGRAGGIASLWILKFLAKKVVFLVFSGKKLISIPRLDKFWKNPLVLPPHRKKSFRPR